jgi:hypothetical protein
VLVPGRNANETKRFRRRIAIMAGHFAAAHRGTAFKLNIGTGERRYEGSDAASSYPVKPEQP